MIEKIKVSRKDLMQMLGIKNYTFKEIIKNNKLEERINRLGYKYINKIKEGRNSYFILEKDSNTENVNTYNGILKNLFNIKENNYEKFTKYLIYRFANIRKPITNNLIANNINVNKKTIERWNKKLIENGLLIKVGSYVVKKTIINEDNKSIYELSNEEEFNGYYRTVSYLNWNSKVLNKAYNDLKYKENNNINTFYERGIIDNLWTLKGSKQYSIYKNDIKDKFLFKIDKYDIPIDDKGNINQLLIDLLRMAKNIYNINVDDYLIKSNFI